MTATTDFLEKQLKGIHLTLGDTVYADFAGELHVCYECTLRDPETFLALLTPIEMEDLRKAPNEQDWVEEFVTENMFDTELTGDCPSAEDFGLVIDSWDKD